MSVASAIHNAMQSFPLNLDNPSNPRKTHSSLRPLCSPTPVTPSQFSKTASRNSSIWADPCLRTFWTRPEAMDLGFNCSAGSTFMAPPGWVQSHLLAALVSYLVRHQERVVYIPDCRAALENPFHSIRGALPFAFYGAGDSWRAIAQAENMDGLIAVVECQPDYFSTSLWTSITPWTSTGTKKIMPTTPRKPFLRPLRVSAITRNIFSVLL